jgi:hypothetical protein
MVWKKDGWWKEEVVDVEGTKSRRGACVIRQGGGTRYG